MKKIKFENITEKTQAELSELSNEIRKSNEASQKELIDNMSPYSENINRHIKTYDELSMYCEIGLAEATLTRKALVRKINNDLWITSRSKTNRELMLGGNPPYAFDSPEGCIELHHIGQDYDAPFAELTQQEHVLSGDSKKLHQSPNDSWRQDPQKEAAFEKERRQYWKMRACMEGIDQNICVKKLPVIDGTGQKVSSAMITKRIIENLFPECSSDDLKFISDTAWSQAMIQDFGVRSFNDFICQSSQNTSVVCPHCESINHSLYGQYISHGEKIQKYKCKSCGRIFTLMNKTILSESNLSFSEWIVFINCLYNGMTIEKTAELCHISTKSVHNNRLRIFYALKILDDQIRLKGEVAIDETYFPNNYKGNRTHQKGFSLERKPRKRGSEIHTPGLSKEQVCVVCAIDENNVSIARVAGFGAPTGNHIQKAIGHNIVKDDLTCIYTDETGASNKYAKMNGFPIKQAKSPAKNKFVDKETAEIQRRIQIVGSFHSRLKKHFVKFSGISSALLNGYLSLFAWKDRNRNKETVEAFKELFNVLIQPNLYKSISEIANMPCFSEIPSVENKSLQTHFKDFARAEFIFAQFASGKKMTDIAKELNVTKQAVSATIKKFRQLGFGYKTNKEILEEEKANRIKQIPYPYTCNERNRQIYLDKLAWDGPLNDFYEMEMKKHKIAKQTIKNIVSREKRTVALTEAIYVDQKFHYRTLDEVYDLIHEDYFLLSEKRHSRGDELQAVADKYGYTAQNIYRILGITQTKSSADAISSKKLAKTETTNRDKAIFVDFLNWEGSKHMFCIWASKKYNLNYYYVYSVLRLSFIADPTRYEITYLPPMPRKE